MTSTSTDRRQGVNAGSAFKVPVRVATTAALAALSGLLTVDGVVLVSGDRVLVKNQVDTTTNGIYDVATGAWTRSVDADGTFDLKDGSLVQVSHGTVNARLVYVCTSADTITIGTSAITFAAMNPGTPITTPLAIALGGTGQITKSAAAAALGIVSLTGGAGTANAQTAAAPSSYTAFALNDVFEYTPPLTNTGAVTITITPAGGGALAAQAVKYDGAACAGGELVLGVPTLLMSDGAGNLNIIGYSRKVRSSQLGMSFNLINGTIVQTRAGSAETIAIKTAAGADPSAADPVGVIVRDQAATTGGYTVRWLTAATSLTISSGSTMGAANSIAFRLWYVLFDDAGTMRLGAINCVTTTAGAGTGRDVTAIFPLSGWGVASSTAEGGAGAADNAQTFYTGVAVSSKPYATIGFATWESGLAAVGTWGTAPSRISVWGAQQALPGYIVQVQRTPSGALATGATGAAFADAIMQNTSGNQWQSQAITPSSAANALIVESLFTTATGAAQLMTTGLFRDATANALCSFSSGISPTADWPMQAIIRHWVLAELTVATTFKVRSGTSGAGNISFNGSGGSRTGGGANLSNISVTEIMG